MADPAAYSNSAVRTANKRMLDAAVTRYMSEIGWFGSADEGYRGNSWEGTLPPVTGMTGTVRIKEQHPGELVAAG